MFTVNPWEGAARITANLAACSGVGVFDSGDERHSGASLQILQRSCRSPGAITLSTTGNGNEVFGTPGFAAGRRAPARALL